VGTIQREGQSPEGAKETLRGKHGFSGAAEREVLWKGTALAVPPAIGRQTGEVVETFYNSFFGNVIKGL
jgi:hypothetical protein